MSSCISIMYRHWLTSSLSSFYVSWFSQVSLLSQPFLNKTTVVWGHFLNFAGSKFVPQLTFWRCSHSIFLLLFQGKIPRVQLNEWKVMILPPKAWRQLVISVHYLFPKPYPNKLQHANILIAIPVSAQTLWHPWEKLLGKTGQDKIRKRLKKRKTESNFKRLNLILRSQWSQLLICDQRIGTNLLFWYIVLCRSAINPFVKIKMFCFCWQRQGGADSTLCSFLNL